MANAARGEVAFKLGDETYVLRPTFGAVCEIEDALGTNLFDLGRKLERAEVTARELTAFAQACLAQSGHKLAQEALGSLILEHGALDVIAALVKYCQAYAFGGTEEKKSAEPPAPSQSTTLETTSART